MRDSRPVAAGNGGSNARLDSTGGGYASMPMGRGLATLPGDEIEAATPDEMMRWSADPVVDFRKKITTYIIVNAVILFFAIFTGKNFLGLSAIWGVFMAFKYAKLWSEGYDWRDVFKQPRDRLFFDVAAETIDDARGLFDRSKRAEIRERVRRRRIADASGVRTPESTQAPIGALPAGTAREHAGRFGDLVSQAGRDRAEIVRIMESVPKREREQLSHVVPSADALYRKVESLAIAAADLERNATPNAGEAIEREITQLEAQANPLDHAASEDRVRRLAYLKRQRRAVADVSSRRDQAIAKLESCRAALQSMRLDLVRLRTGAETHERITLLAEQAMSLARDVDGLVYGADEVAKLTARGRTGGRSLAGPA
jgi:serine/threonine-protein kinase